MAPAKLYFLAQTKHTRFLQDVMVRFPQDNEGTHIFPFAFLVQMWQVWEVCAGPLALLLRLFLGKSVDFPLPFTLPLEIP